MSPTPSPRDRPWMTSTPSSLTFVLSSLVQAFSNFKKSRVCLPGSTLLKIAKYSELLSHVSRPIRNREGSTPTLSHHLLQLGAACCVYFLVCIGSMVEPHGSWKQTKAKTTQILALDYN